MSNTARPSLTKSPLALARVALAVGESALPTYASLFSRKDFTLPQLFAILTLRRFFRTDYRGIVVFLKEFAELRKALGIAKVPHFTTLQKVENSLLKRGASTACSALFSLTPKITV